MPSQKEKEIFATIINKYREMPYLWQKNHKYYKHRSMRDEGFGILLEIYKEYDECGTAKILKKKLDNMRTSFVRELKKATASKQTDTEYIPSLWYYDALSFLAPYTARNVNATDPLENTITSSDDEDVSIANSSNSLQKKKKNFTQKQENIIVSAKKIVTQNKEESDNHTDHIMYLEIASSDEETSSVANSFSRRHKRKKKETQFQKQEKIFLSKDNIMVRKEEEWEVYGRSIGIQIKNLGKRQLAIAQKLISDVIFYATLDQLTESSYVVRMPTNDDFHEQNQTYKGSPPSNRSSPSH